MPSCRPPRPPPWSTRFCVVLASSLRDLLDQCVIHIAVPRGGHAPLRGKSVPAGKGRAPGRGIHAREASTDVVFFVIEIRVVQDPPAAA